MTTGNGDLAAAFADGPALIPYVTAGDPSLAATREYVHALVRGGADVVELGLPFSEPIAEGPTIQRAIDRALDAGTTPDRFFEFAAALDVEVPLVVMTYYNLVYQYGEAAGPAPFAAAAADAGLSGIIVPDLPVEESGPLRRACDAHGLDSVFIVAPTTGDDRLERILDRTSGFVYVQARLGTTGAREDLDERTVEQLARFAEYDVPTAVGFGISEREHAAAVVAGGADGVIVGSALVEVIAEGVEADRPTAAVADRLESTVGELAAGVEEGLAQGVPEPEHK